MKRLVTLAACLAMLTFTGCANGILCGGLFGNSSGCKSRPTMFSGNGLLSNGPIRQFMRGDACDSCNAAAGQVSSTCDDCLSAGQSDPYALPMNGSMGAPMTQPATSFYPSDNGVSLGQPLINSDNMAPIDAGNMLGTPGDIGGFGAFDEGLAEPPSGIK